jgi:hypothetical protein
MLHRLSSLLGLLCLSCAQGETLKIKVPEGVDEITFDAKTVSADELKEWLVLSPVLSQNNDYLVPEYLDACNAPANPDGTPCTYSDDAFNAANARRNIDRIRRRIERLTAARLPRELEPVRKYFAKVQALGLWRTERVLEFMRTGDISNLEGRYGSVDLKAACAQVLQGIRQAPDQGAALELVRTPWTNCAWFHVRDADIGEYPERMWNSFLASKGVRERLIVIEE